MEKCALTRFSDYFFLIIQISLINKFTIAITSNYFLDLPFGLLVLTHCVKKANVENKQFMRTFAAKKLPETLAGK